MDKNLFSSFNSAKSAGFNVAIVEAVLNAVPTGMQFLRTIRDNQNNIVDFEYVLLNNGAGADTAGKTFLNLYPGNKQLFEKLKQLAETGSPFETGHLPESANGKIALNFMKFADGILMSGYDGGDGVKKNNVAAEQESKTTGHTPHAGPKTVEEPIELNQILEERNKELESLNAELKTINSVAAIEYKETIQKLYTNLEYIVSNNAKTLNDASKANIRRAQATIQRMKLLSEDINSFLQLYDFGIHKTVIDPNLVLENVISKIKEKMDQANASIESVRLPNLFADPLLLSILLGRLFDNSIKFRKLIVAPLIRIKYSQADEINTVKGALKDTPYVIISVSDNGIGFPDEGAETIFELFFRGHDGKYRGSGIGLAVCKKIMTMHGGFITAEGSPANGAVFNCYFPLKK